MPFTLLLPEGGVVPEATLPGYKIDDDRADCDLGLLIRRRGFARLVTNYSGFRTTLFPCLGPTQVSMPLAVTRRLHHGDIIEFEDVRYRYIRSAPAQRPA